MQTEAYEVSGTRGKNIKDRFVEAEYEDTEPWLDEASAVERLRLRDAFPKPRKPRRTHCRRGPSLFRLLADTHLVRQVFSKA
jgi:hypothetical protein